MGRWAPRYSDEQRAAIISAILDRGMTAREAVEAAAAGDLGLPAFSMPATTASEYARRARIARQADATAATYTDDPAAALQALDGRIYRLIERETTRLERLQRTGRLKPSDLLALVRARREFGGRAKQPAAPQPAEQPKTQDPHPLDHLAQRLHTT